ncbi:dipeptide ABC transporter ATP-binding protein [soil metagenome]
MDNIAPETREAAEAARTVERTTVPGARREGGPGAWANRGAEPVLDVEAVKKHFPGTGAGRSPVKAVDGVSFTLFPGETLGLIGESGCGKSTLARVITQLLPATTGHVRFDGVDLTTLSSRELRRVRRRMQMIFQDPFGALDPRQSVGASIAEPLDNFGLAPGSARRRRVRELLDLVGLDPDNADRHPHELSGGQRQRIGIARALAPEPSLVVCDEPVSSLDVSIQAQIINLLKGLQQRLGLTYLFIAHDLALVRHLCDRVAVMYLGRIVEIGVAADLYDRPRHPYTKALLDAIPVADPQAQRTRPATVLEGEPSSADDLPHGCRFHPRCSIARAPGICSEQEPVLEEQEGSDHLSACHFPEGVAAPSLR